MADVEKKKYCPRGTRKNRKTGKCEPIASSSPAKDPPKEPSPVAVADEPNTNKRKYCPRGTRKNKKTGKCEPVNPKNAKNANAKNASSPIAPVPTSPLISAIQSTFKAIARPIMKPDDSIEIKTKGDPSKPKVKSSSLEKPASPAQSALPSLPRLPIDSLVLAKKKALQLEPTPSLAPFSAKETAMSAKPQEEEKQEEEEVEEEEPTKPQEEDEPEEGEVEEEEPTKPQEEEKQEEEEEEETDPEELVEESIQKKPTEPVSLPKNPPPVILDNLISGVEKNSNAYLKQKEKIQYDNTDSVKTRDYLYPHLDDPHFAQKIAERKEFVDTRYSIEGKTILPIKEQAEKMCSAEFELLPHQHFVKQFLSFQTPYNSLLLYHGLGSGKTCTAIGIAEEMREYAKRIGMKQNIIVVAAPNVQANFKMQLFNERNLREIDGLWTIQSCVGDAFIHEVNPTHLKNIPRDQIVSQVKHIISRSYKFMGYIELANFIYKNVYVGPETGYSAEERRKMEIRNVRRFFDNKLIIIDEVHNIRSTAENVKGSDISMTVGSISPMNALMTIAKYSNHLRFVLLSATPMYNTYKEIIWLVNLMNVNDKRATIQESEVFDKNGQWKPEKKGPKGEILVEGGRELLHRKMIGYVSYVRGENPYTFPYRIFPTDFDEKHTFRDLAMLKLLTGNASEQYKVPTKQFNGKKIDDPLQHLPVYVSEIGEYQAKAYQLIMNAMRRDIENAMMQNPLAFEEMDRFGFRRLQTPLEALNMVFPSENLDKRIEQNNLDLAILDSETGEDDDLSDLSAKNVDIDDENNEINADPRAVMVGKRGLRSIMTYTGDKPGMYVPVKHQFQYREGVVEKYGRIFRPDVLKTYSAKLSSICESIQSSTGIVIIYSQYIDGGTVPAALALEEMGFTKYGAGDYTQSLFAKPPTEPIDAITMKPRSRMPPGASFKPAKYVIITGDRGFSPKNAEEVKIASGADNAHGEIIKVIIISKAGSEGLDFKNIRQIHILDPWYNLNRIEQIIGRGVRNLSHCALPFEERNVEIYMHSTVLLGKQADEEAADVYVYRLAKKKAERIGQVTRLIKESAVDCLLNIGQTEMTVQKLNALAANQKIELELSTGRKKIVYQIGDKPHTDICDHMDNCQTKCMPDVKVRPTIVQDTYSLDHLHSSNARLMQRIRQLFRDPDDGQHFYRLSEMIAHINAVKQYPIEQIYSALNAFLQNKNEVLLDKYGRQGNLINKNKLYAFQPIEINDENITVFERSTPVDYKRTTVGFETPPDFATRATAADNGTEKDPTLQPELQPPPLAEHQYKEIIDGITKNVARATEGLTEEGQEKDWYHHMYTVIDHLQLVHQIGFGELVDYTIQHAVDVLLPHEKKVLISRFYSKVIDESRWTEVERAIKTYMDSLVVHGQGNKMGILFAEKDQWKLYIPSPNTPEAEWVEADKEDIRPFIMSKILDKTFAIDHSKWSTNVGFVNLFKTGKEMVFRIKDINQMQNNTGSRIDPPYQIKQDNLIRLNKIIKNKPLANQKYIEYNNKNTKEFLALGICVIIEVILRHYEATKKDSLHWFFRPEIAAYNQVVKYRRIV